MKKVLLSLVALFALSLGAYATDDISLPLDEDTSLGSGWNSSYDASTQTISFTGTWAGRGWWLGDEDYSDYAGVKVVIKTAATSYVNLITQYNYYASYDEETGEGVGDALSSTDGITGTGDATVEQTLYCAFDDDMKNSVMQIYIQNATTDDITIVSATVIANENADDEVEAAYEGVDITATASNWDSGATGTVNDDGTVAATFPDAWTSLGWNNYDPGWDLTDYDAVVLTYKDLTSDTGTAKLQLYIGDGTTWAGDTKAGTADESGTIEYVIAEQAELDYTNIEQIFVQASEACTATIVSIEFVKYSDEEGDESVDASDYYTNLDFETGDLTGWTVADSNSMTVESTTGGPDDAGGDYYFLANYGNDFTASTDVIKQTSTEELPAGTYTVSATICVGDNGCDGNIELYATDGTTTASQTISNSANYGDAGTTSVELTLDEAAEVTIGIRTTENYASTGWLWLYADDFAVEAEGGDATGITSVPAVTATGNGAIYNLAGQRVNAGTKGLLIIDGKKVLVK